MRKCQQHRARCLACCLLGWFVALWGTVGRAPPCPTLLGVPLLLLGLPSTAYLLVHQGQGWTAPRGGWGEQSSIYHHTEPRGGREMGRKQGGCWLHPRFGRGEQRLVCLCMPWDNWAFSSISALLYNWELGEGW